MTDTKQKLTLTVDSETVEAAKKLGLNISELTERVLRGYTFDPEGLERGNTLEQYQSLLRTMDPLLTKYGRSIVIGHCWSDAAADDPEPVFYDGRDHFYFELEVGDNEYENQSTPISSVTFARPTEILKRFLTAVDAARTSRREEAASMFLAKRLVEALNEQESNRPSRAARPKPRRGGSK